MEKLTKTWILFVSKNAKSYKDLYFSKLLDLKAINNFVEFAKFPAIHTFEIFSITVYDKFFKMADQLPF